MTDLNITLEEENIEKILDELKGSEEDNTITKEMMEDMDTHSWRRCPEIPV